MLSALQTAPSLARDTSTLSALSLCAAWLERRVSRASAVFPTDLLSVNEFAAASCWRCHDARRRLLSCNSSLLLPRNIGHSALIPGTQSGESIRPTFHGVSTS